ncbi:MAG: retention module-containing protein, partial [Gammaproteobacteria bacterium]|nr:retention module-containing protein [Gammaproteobacteria bacterium]
MSEQVIATIASIDGKAYARDASGELRALRAGDNLLRGETLVTPEGSTAELTLLDGSLLLVNDVTELAITGDLVAELAAGRDESAADDATVAQVLAALESGEDLSEVLDPPAAGAQGPASEGHDYVRLARILEETSEFSGIAPVIAVDEEVVFDQDDLFPVDAVDDTETTEQGQPVTINVEANDDFREGSRVVSVSDPENGVAVINADDTVTYTPNPGFVGTDTFTYTAVSPDGNAGDTAVVTVIVTGNPVPPVLPTLSIGDDIVFEGELAEVTVTLSAPSDVPVTVAFATADDSATVVGGDYDPVTGTITFAPGQTAAIVQVQTNQDTLAEGTEQLTVNLSNPSNATIADPVGVVVIEEQGTPPPPPPPPPELPTIEIGDQVVFEGQLARVTVTLSEPSDEPVTVNFVTTDGTATVSGGDYDPQSGTITFAPGVTQVRIEVDTNADRLEELNETFDIILSDASNATIADDTGTVTIRDIFIPVQPDPVRVGISGSTVEEGALAKFTVTLDDASDRAQTVNLSTVNGTADGSDYVTSQFFDAAGNPISSALVFAAGETSKDVYVQTIDNDPPVGEPIENYTVRANLVGGNTASAQGRITDSDGTSVSITGSTVEEGALAKFTVTLSQASASDETVNLSAITGTADASDFNTTQFFDAAGNPISSTVVFAAGETSKDVYVQTINNDPPVGEPLENYTVQAALVGGNTASAQGGITDSDVASVAITGSTV